MQLIVWKVSRKHHLLSLGAVILTALLSHLCCIGSLVLVPLGFGSISMVLEKTVGNLKWILVIPVILLIINGWKIYRNPSSHLVEKVAFWISVAVVALMIYW